MDNIAEKIEKLLALSQSSNENEAAAAAAKVAEMLTQHNITLADLAKSPVEPIEAATIEQFKKNVPWKLFLLQAIAEANYCRALSRFSRHSLKQAVVIGRPTNILVVQQLYEYLVQAVDRVTKEALAAPKNSVSGDSRRTFANNFRKGCAIRLKERLEAKRRQIESEGIPGTATQSSVSALVCRSLSERETSAINVYLSQSGIAISQTKSQISGDGYAAGIEAAESIGLDRQVQPSNILKLPGTSHDNR